LAGGNYALKESPGSADASYWGSVQASASDRSTNFEKQQRRALSDTSRHGRIGGRQGVRLKGLALRSARDATCALGSHALRGKPPYRKSQWGWRYRGVRLPTAIKPVLNCHSPRRFDDAPLPGQQLIRNGREHGSRGRERDARSIPPQCATSHCPAPLVSARRPGLG